MSDKLDIQMKRRVTDKSELIIENKGNFDSVISTGSTLLDLAISGGRVRGGGLPGGIFVEIYGPESTGKSALACEISGNIQHAGGTVMYDDPEGRIDSQYAMIYGVHLNKDNYRQSDTITEVFSPILEWTPEGNAIHGIIIDSLAALSTKMEMEGEDKMGGRRGTEFSQELRKTCREVKKKNYLMVCTNQLRDTFNIIGPKHASSGGWAIRYYSSLRLETNLTKQNRYIIKKKTVRGKVHERVIGINIIVKVVKSSVWQPFLTAPVSIVFNYGIDDIRQNLQYVKDNNSFGFYSLDGKKLAVGLEDAITMIEKDDSFIYQLKEETIDLWEEIELRENKYKRKPKK